MTVDPAQSTPRHRHVWTALHYKPGPYGDQGTHRHVCFDENCDVELEGKSDRCDGDRKTHKVLHHA